MACALSQSNIIPIDLISQRFWPKANKTSSCWLWEGTKRSKGYGTFMLRGLQCRAHRVAWELTYGPIPRGMEICHHCDNPACVRPDHLFLGTQKDNIQDAITKGRLNPKNCCQPTGENNGRAILTATQVNEIREIYAHKGERYSRSITQRKLAHQFGISRRTIADILKLRTWRLTRCPA